ncbi:MAG: DUF3014 domain-containing protein [Gammaproteobacteria bacterium]|nr:DUF3014 domain-containing protein [Gammaproteobacteria bacterium]MDH3370647.1 DUF3014 domain-containing protein [Gammaproteobacteria bacterium]MDH3405601.1 DUF3014 domain-containing protein [Gammaproteobacteria bacterium]MDH3562984.1 DUF3014 domain-containing protein [Gammaproteobacteria bacterium]MDH5486570.1 DUF3014 domain-containing protein [Gammaproteobacteria bacterium]
MKNTMWLVVVLVIGGIAAGFYFWQLKKDETPPPVAESTLPAAPPEPQIKHPIREAPASDEPLPLLEDSDGALLGALTGFFGQKAVQEFFEVKELARRFVVTVDNLPRQKVPLRYRLFKPVAGKFLVTGVGDDFLSKPENHRRYNAYVLLTGAVDIKKLVAVYTRFYPLFQEEYVNLGYPQGYFNDRLVVAIDDMLAAPDISGSIKLIRPKVLYLFADPALEELSAGQKIMIRMGVENAVRVKARLREFRKELIYKAPKTEETTTEPTTNKN